MNKKNLDVDPTKNTEETSPLTPQPTPQISTNEISIPQRSGSSVFTIGTVVLAVVIVGVVIGVAVNFKNKKNSQSSLVEQSQQVATVSPSVPEESKIVGDFEVVVKENPTDESSADIYLKDIQSQHETLFLTLENVEQGRYYQIKLVNGYIYVIKRIGYDGYRDDDWTEELWKYGSEKQGIKLFSSRGLSFRVSGDGKYIAILGTETNSITDEKLTFITGIGNTVHTILPKELQIEQPALMEWHEPYFWFSDSFGPSYRKLVKINIENSELLQYELPTSVGPDADLNVVSEKVASSNHPPLFDVDSANEFYESGKTVTLTVYDLKTKTEQQIATAVAKLFNPEWIDEVTLEYDDPNGKGRLTVEIP